MPNGTFGNVGIGRRYARFPRVQHPRYLRERFTHAQQRPNGLVNLGRVPLRHVT
jgi:hypothetical protein